MGKVVIIATWTLQIMVIIFQVLVTFAFIMSGKENYATYFGLVALSTIGLVVFLHRKGIGRSPQ